MERLSPLGNYRFVLTLAFNRMFVQRQRTTTTVRLMRLKVYVGSFGRFFKKRLIDKISPMSKETSISDYREGSLFVDHKYNMKSKKVKSGKVDPTLKNLSTVTKNPKTHNSRIEVQTCLNRELFPIKNYCIVHTVVKFSRQSRGFLVLPSFPFKEESPRLLNLCSVPLPVTGVTLVVKGIDMFPQS